MPPLPRSREGNENPKSHCHERTMMGRRVSRRPEAGKPIHRGSSRGDSYGYITSKNHSSPVPPIPRFRPHG